MQNWLYSTGYYLYKLSATDFFTISKTVLFYTDTTLLLLPDSQILYIALKIACYSISLAILLFHPLGTP